MLENIHVIHLEIENLKCYIEYVFFRFYEKFVSVRKNFPSIYKY